MAQHDFVLPGDYADDPGAAVLLDAATADPQPSSFHINSALIAAGIKPDRMRTYELLDGKTHVCMALPQGRHWQSLDSLAAAMLEA